MQKKCMELQCMATLVAPKHETKPQSPRKPGRPPKAKAPAKAAAAVSQVPVDTSTAKPSFAHEKSRMQYLARTGLKGPGQTKAFKYTDEDSRQQAFASAKSWIAP